MTSVTQITIKLPFWYHNPTSHSHSFCTLSHQMNWNLKHLSICPSRENVCFSQ